MAARLARAGCVAADEEAAELIRAAGDPEDLEGRLARRERGEPLAWIVGSVRFCGHDVGVDPGVYVPRSQTEALARRAADKLGSAANVPGPGRPVGSAPPSGRAVDLCTGAGPVAIHLRAAWPGALVVGVDIDHQAVACARRNGVTTVVADLDELDPPLRSGAFDVVTAVAPYVPAGEVHLLPADVQRYEPRRALDGGPDGLRLVRRIVGAAARLLCPGGWLVLELGGEQDRQLTSELGSSGFGPAEPWFDDEGDLRGMSAPYVGRPATG